MAAVEQEEWKTCISRDGN